MSKLSVIVYTMKGCPHCKDFKELLVKEGIEFHDRDIDEYEEEYDIFSKVTDNMNLFYMFPKKITTSLRKP
jgi:glutaredoxin